MTSQSLSLVIAGLQAALTGKRRSLPSYQKDVTNREKEVADWTAKVTEATEWIDQIDAARDLIEEDGTAVPIIWNDLEEQLSAWLNKRELWEAQLAAAEERLTANVNAFDGCQNTINEIVATLDILTATKNPGSEDLSESETRTDRSTT